MSAITLETASRIVDETLGHGRRTDCDPLSAVVLDPGGHIVALKREDRAGILRNEIAIGKAFGTLGMGLGGRTLAQRADGAPTFFTTVAIAAQGRFVPREGGVLVRDADGGLLGAVGVSGDTSEKDEACAVAGIEAAGLIADVGA